MPSGVWGTPAATRPAVTWNAALYEHEEGPAPVFDTEGEPNFFCGVAVWRAPWAMGYHGWSGRASPAGRWSPSYGFIISHWTMAALATAGILAEWAGVIRRGRRAGVCRGCGYDMRATPERCPECGLAAGKAGESSRMEAELLMCRAKAAAVTAGCFAAIVAAVVLYMALLAEVQMAQRHGVRVDERAIGRVMPGVAAIGWLAVYGVLRGVTVGMRMQGLVFARADGRRAGRARCVARIAAGLGLASLLPVSLVVMAYDQQRRGLGDWVCGTVVKGGFEI